MQVKSGSVTAEEVMNSLLGLFIEAGLDAHVPEEVFLAYLAGVSSAVPSDAAFEALLRCEWETVA
ncbi:hypothetical protein EON67_08855 [archaeon]|nr:MAG: hypothetical protein EON67_08855 [archaeon]